MSLFKENGFHAFPGAYIVNSPNGAYPIYKSSTDLTKNGCFNKNNYIILLPGFKAICYTTINYGTQYATPLNNTTNTVYFYKFTTADTVKSIKLYCNNVELI